MSGTQEISFNESGCWVCLSVSLKLVAYLYISLVAWDGSSHWNGVVHNVDTVKLWYERMFLWTTILLLQLLVDILVYDGWSFILLAIQWLFILVPSFNYLRSSLKRSVCSMILNVTFVKLFYSMWSKRFAAKRVYRWRWGPVIIIIEPRGLLFSGFRFLRLDKFVRQSVF